MIDIAAGPAIADGSGDLLAVPVFADVTWGPGARYAAEQLGNGLEDFLEAQEFTGKAGQVVAVPGGDLPYTEVLFVGLGEEADAEAIRRAAGQVGKRARPHRVVATTLHAIDVEGAAEAVALGFLLGSYRFDRYRSDPQAVATESLVLLGSDDATSSAAERGAIIARGVGLARDLVNEPAVAKPPVMLAERATRLSELIEAEVIDESAAAKRGFGGLLAVAAGATNPPRMVILRYRPEDAAAHLAIVGKGIVFDSGGLSIKPANMMEEMKTDMAGAAVVYGAMQAIADLGIPVAVTGIAPLTENMSGGLAQRPGDVMTAYRGKTVEVLNTDAEGRLVLADGLGIAVEEEPDLIVDVATLTGACKVALGPNIAGMFSNDPEALARVEAAARFAGEKMWPLPLETEYRKMIDSPIADMKNIGGRYGGAILAALFLAEFVGEVPWVHVDIAGPARADAAEHYVTKGATGFGVRTIVSLASSLAEA